MEGLTVGSDISMAAVSGYHSFTKLHPAVHRTMQGGGCIETCLSSLGYNSVTPVRFRRRCRIEGEAGAWGLSPGPVKPWFLCAFLLIYAIMDEMHIP